MLRTCWVFLVGLIASGGFPPLAKWWLFPCALALFVAHTINQSLRTRLINSFFFAIGFFAPMLHWSSSFVGVIPWLLLTVLCAFFYLPLSITLKNSRYLILTFPLVWVAVEALRNRIPFGGFAWGRAGYLVVDSPYLETLTYIGVAGGSLLMVFIGVAIYRIFSGFRIYWIPALILIAFIPAYHLPATGSITMTSVQGNVPRLGYEISTQVRKVFENHAKETLRHSQLSNANPPDVYVWPEDGADIDPLKTGRKEISTLMSQVNAPIIFGSVGRDNLDRPVNFSILWRAGGASSIYQKQHLAPFGEYIPLRSLAARISPLVEQVRDFIPGTSWKYHYVDKAIIAPLICFEVADDHLIRQAVTKANILIAQTNNATYGRSAQSRQQLQITRSRALEHHRAIASISTVGVSAMINSKGEILSELAPYTTGSLRATLPLYEGVTPAGRASLGIEYLALAWAGLMAIASLRRVFRR